MKVIATSVILLIVGLFVSAVNGELRQAENMDTQGFDKDTRSCEACVLFAKCLHSQVQRTQPGPQYTNPAERKRYIRREERVDDVIDDAVKSVLSDFVWAEIGDPIPDGSEAPKKLPQGAELVNAESRFWALRELKQANAIDRATLEGLEAQAARGGDVQLQNFLRSDVIGERIDELEDQIAANTWAEENHQDYRSWEAATFPSSHPKKLKTVVHRWCKAHCKKGEEVLRHLPKRAQ